MHSFRALSCGGYSVFLVDLYDDLPISIRVISLALGQSNDCPNANEVTLMEMGKTDQYKITKQRNTVYSA